jgi:uncharacterized membrane protein
MKKAKVQSVGLLNQAFFKRGAVLALMMSATTTSFAAECSRYERDKAQSLAERAAEKIIAKFMGGRDLRLNLESCEFNSYDSKFRTKVGIYWNGAIVRSNSYNTDGLLSFNGDGSNANFSQSYASQSVKDLTFWGTVAGGALVLGALSASPSSGSSNTPAPQTALTQTPSSGAQGVPVYVHNDCSRPVNVALQWKSEEGDWKTAGWWGFSPRERSQLNDEGKTLKTRSSTIYVSAKTTDGSSMLWEGSQTSTLAGQTLRLKEVVDNSPDKTEIRLTCN